MKYEWLLYPERYREKVALSGHWQEDQTEKDFCMIIVDDLRLGKIIVGLVFLKDDQNLHIEYSFFAMHPEYRKGALGVKLSNTIGSFDYTKRLEEESGAEYLSGFAKHGTVLHNFYV